jgi:outer membrane receptor protein involved in Fe transport
MPITRIVPSKPIVALSVASLLICSLAETARSQTAEPTPAPTPSPAPQNAAPSPAPAENAPPSPSANAPATVLPQTNVQAPKQAARQKPRAVAREAAPQPAQAAPPSPEAQAAARLAAKNATFDQARSNIFTQVGTNSDTISHSTIQDLPQGDNSSVEKVLLQLPGVSQDSAASGSLHVRNDHANLQYRINGILLPDGVTGLGSIFDTSFIGSLSLVTGALPAEYGLRTTGLVDIKTRTDLFNNSGSVGVYGGSFGTIQPSFEYGGTFGNTCPTTTTPGTYKAPASASDCFAGVQYYFTGRYTQNTVGIESATPTYNAFHDFSQQDRGFAYMSAVVDPTTRVSLIAGTAYNNFQIPNRPDQPVGQMGNPPVVSAFGVTNFNSLLLNENQVEQTQFSVLTAQKSVDGFDGQLSFFTRYSNLHYTPDPIGDLLINGIASDITRQSLVNGLQGDGSYKLSDSHTLRAGFSVSGEQVAVGNTSLVEPAPGGTPIDAPFNITDNVSKLGWLAGVYVQDEWKLTNQLTMNYGLRFDQMDQFVSANQFSPRLSFTYKPFDNTTFHIGYARYFTPPVLVEAAPANIAAFNGTTGAAPAGQANDPVLPERSHYFDAGVDQTFKFGCGSDGRSCSALDLGVDAYYKIAQDLIDNGFFGQALVLDAFNYARGYNEGIEFKAKWTSGNFQAYGNLSVAQQRANDPVSSQFLFDNTTPLADLGGMTLFQYLQTHFIYTDHNQFVTASAGALYKFCGRPATSAEAFGNDGFSWCGVTLSADAIYGSGLRDGDANITTVPSYTQVNIGIKREFLLPNDPKPMTIRFDVVNLFDQIYEIRDGTGIGVFAPQFGPRRGFYLGISKKI